VNTYNWINATANSKIINRICTVNILDSRIVLNICLDESINDISKWPAIILDVSRIDNIVRVTCLIVSIITINYIRIIGVPWGVKWEHVSLK